MELKPIFSVNGKDYELKKTRALMVEWQRINKENHLDEESSNKILEVQENLKETQKEIESLVERVETARNEYYDEPTNKDKKDKFNALKELLKEAKKPLTNAKSEEMELANKSMKILLDNYEKAIIFAISEQYDMSMSNAEKVWQDFVEEIGLAKASQWVYEIGDTLFNEEENGNDFLAKKRAMEQQRQVARSQIRKK